MRSLVISAVVLLCGAQIAYSFHCYTCTMAINDASCQTVTNCTGSTPFCGTAVVNGIFATFVNKFCAAACVNANQNFTIVSASEMCCASNLCNDQMIGDVNSMLNFGNGASGLTGSAFLMVLLGGLLSYMFAL